MLAELNRFRADPSSFQKQLEDRKDYVNHNNLLFSPRHPNKSIKTKEGRLPINELIGQLHNDRELTQLSDCATFIAQNYTRQNLDEQTFLQGMSQQIRRRINSSSLVFDGIKCLIGVGFKDEGEPLISILIDDGDKQRKKRKILLGNNFQQCGAGWCALADPSLVCGVYLLATHRE